MRLKTLFVISCLFACATSFAANHAETTTLFFGKDQRQPIHQTTLLPWSAIGQLETASGNLCSVTLITPNLALTAGHCMLVPPGLRDKAVALRFIPQGKGQWRETFRDIDTWVSPELVKKLKPDGEGWIVPPAAAVFDVGLIILKTSPADITPIPLFAGDAKSLMTTLKSTQNKVTQAGYPEDHLNTLYAHRDCLITGWAQQDVLAHRCNTLPGDSGSPLLIQKNGQWQLLAVQSSAPAAQDRYLADNRAIAVTAFRDKLPWLKLPLKAE